MAVFLNSGLVHRIGVSRLYVNMARALAADGITSLRFDFSGIGDSDPRRDSLTFEQGAVEEVGNAIDYLISSRGASQIVLVGLCSGADMAFYAALTDERVIAMCMLDPFVYRTPYFQVLRYGPRILSRTSWRNLVTGRNKIGRAIRRLASARDQEADMEAGSDMVISPYSRTFPPKAKVVAGLRTLADRGVKMLNIFSSGMEHDYNHQGQYRRTFRDVPFRGLMEEYYFPAADHVFSRLEQQQRAVELLRSWFRSNCPGPTDPASSLPVQAVSARV